MNDEDIMIMNVDPEEIAKIVHDYIERVMGCGILYDRFNSLATPIYIGPVKVKSLKEKIDDYKRRKKEMKATSVQKIENVNNICFSIENHPAEMESKLVIVASTNDDIFEFEFKGPELLQICKGAGLFTGWEKDQKIRELETDVSRWKKDAADCLKLRDEAQKEAYKLKQENEKLTIEKAMLKEENEKLEKELGDWKKEASDCLKLRDEVRREKNKEINNLKWQLHNKSIIIKRNDELKKELALEKAANEAQHKFIREYAGKGTEVQFNYAIDDAKEVSYVIVDKEKYNKNFEKWANAQSENAPTSTSRADILDQAKKCVCGQREQDYGTPESNFKLIADLWNDYLGLAENGDGVPIFSIKNITPMDVAMMMALMKIARIKNGGGSGDSFVDLAGYAACGGEIWHGQKVKDQN